MVKGQAKQSHLRRQIHGVKTKQNASKPGVMNSTVFVYSELTSMHCDLSGPLQPELS